MANVMFKRGKQNDLEQYLLKLNADGTPQTGGSQAVDGAFYLTSDTNRLYIGKDFSGNGTNIKAVPVNQGVITVNSIDDLPKKNKIESGQFYYTTRENVLCIFSGGQWVQINPDTNTKLTGRGIAGSTESDFIVITDTITHKDHIAGAADNATAEDFSSAFAVQGLNGVDVTVDEVTINGETRPRIKISQKSYTLKSNVERTQVSINLSDGVSTDKVILKAGDNITLSGSGDESFTISAQDTTLEGGDAGATLGFDDDGNLSFTVSDSGSHTVGNKVKPIIQYGADSSGEPINATFNSAGKLQLNVYSKNQIDTKLNELDALVYKGTVSSAGQGGSINTLPGVNVVKVGWTYKVVGENFRIGSINAKNGDLLIARGTENTSGDYIGTIGSDLTWDHIPSGDDAQYDTLYKVVGIDSGISLTEIAEGGDNTKGGIQLLNKDSKSSADTYLTITNDSGNTGADNEIHKVVITHNEQGELTGTSTVTVNNRDLTQTSFSEISLSVPVLEYDKAGHITKVSSQTYNLVDSKFTYELDYLKSLDTTSTYSGGKLTSESTIKVQMVDLDGEPSSANFKLKSSTLAMKTEEDADGNNSLVVDIEWENF